MGDQILPAKLYKYGRASRVRDVASGRIRFTQAGGLNDPFELRPIFDLSATSNNLLADILSDGPARIRHALSEQYAQLGPSDRAKLPPQEHLAALLFDTGVAQSVLAQAGALTRPLIMEALKHMREQMAALLQANIGILSLTEDPVSVTMWSHYGDDHRGVAIEFEPSHPWFDRRRTEGDEFFRLRPVRYVDLSAPARTFLQVAEENLLLTKGIQWKTEREWRVLARLADADEVLANADEPIHLFRFPSGAVSGLVFGLRAGADRLREARELIHTTPSLAHVRLWRIVAADGTLTLKMQEIGDGA